MKDSIFINNGIIYYGKLDNSQAILDSQLNINTLNRIPGNCIKMMNFNSRKHHITISYNQDDQVTINLDHDCNMTLIQNDILDTFQQSKLLSEEKTRLYIIYKPLIAIAVIFSLILTISFIETKSETPHGSKLTTQAISELLQGFASLGMANVVIIFGTIMLIPVTSIIMKLRNSQGNTIIKF